MNVAIYIALIPFSHIISTRDKAKIVKTVFEVQIQTLTVQLEVLLRNIFFLAFF